MVVRTRRLRERLADSRRDLEPIRKRDHDSNKDVELKLHKVSGVLNEVTRAEDLSAEGELRNQWNALLNDLDLTRKELALALDARDLIEKIRRVIASEDYLGALDLFNGPEFRRAPDLALRDGFLQSLVPTLRRKCDAMARGGET